jgi:hypothetical protein
MDLLEPKTRNWGKLNEDIIIHEMIKDNPKPLYQIAELAGSKAMSQPNKSKAIIQKVATSAKIRKALELHRNKTLEVQATIQTKLYERAEREQLQDKLSPDQLYSHLNKASAMVASLTKESANEGQGSANNTLEIENALIMLAGGRKEN